MPVNAKEEIQATNLVMDFEIEAHLFRLLRTGKYRKALDLLTAAQIDFPNEPTDRLIKCARRLDKRIREVCEVDDENS